MSFWNRLEDALNEKQITPTELSGDVHEVITHLISDTWADYYDWYTSFKTKKALPEIKREDIQVRNNKFYIGEKEAIKISSDIQEQDKTRLEKYITEIFEILQSGNEPAIISVYDDKEARALNKLRDKYRQKK